MDKSKLQLNEELLLKKKRIEDRVFPKKERCYTHITIEKRCLICKQVFITTKNSGFIYCKKCGKL